MTATSETIDLDQVDHGRCRSWPFLQDYCVTCALCAGSCPASGIDGFDPRMLVRMLKPGGPGSAPCAANAKMSVLWRSTLPIWSEKFVH